MGYTKEMAEENRAIYDRAAELLPDAGWTAETEEAERGYISEIAMDQRQSVVEALATEFSDVSQQRIMNQVNNFMVRERGRVWREEQENRD